MRWLFLSLALGAGCGFQVGAGVPGGGDDVVPDAPPDGPRDVPPRIIPGGGIGDAPIDGVLNVYAIDWVTGAPIQDATIDIGDQSGTTDVTGLFVLRSPTLAGKQTVVATAADYRAEQWIGVAGANVTLAMHPLAPAVSHVDVAGTFDMFNTGLPALMPNHVRGGQVGYSQLDGVADLYNNIKTAGGSSCRGGMCAFTITTRTGHVALLGTTYDIDTKNTPDPADDIRVFQTYSYQTGLVLTETGTVPAAVLTQVPPPQLKDLAVTTGTLPPGTTGFFVVAGIDIPTDGCLYLSQVVSGATVTIKSPPIADFPGAQYRVAGLAGHAGTLSIMVRRSLGTGLALDGGAWLVEPAVTDANRTDATWAPSADTTLSGALVSVTMGAEVLNVLSFDGTTSIKWPARVVLPVQMSVEATAQRGALDLTDVSFARDAAKIDGLAYSAATAVP